MKKGIADTSQRCVLESWHIIFQPESLSREVGALPDVYRALLPIPGDRGRITRLGVCDYQNMWYHDYC